MEPALLLPCSQTKLGHLNAAMLRGLSRSRERLAGAVRSYASAELAVADQTPFLKFATPVPQNYNHLQALGSVPETKVCFQTTNFAVHSI